MPTFTRSSAWNNGGTFANTDLLWYAKGVGVMQARTLDNPASWWFFAAIHGADFSHTTYPGWGAIPAPPAVPTSPMPTQAVQDEFWNQCQHQSWYFPPWHRGYLIALEAQLRADIISLGGPATWALPYWNYFGPGSDYEIPPAFTQPTLPGGAPNPLFVTARYGPKLNNDIYVVIPPSSQTCLTDGAYTDEFGGPDTGFNHDGGTSGDLESDPHNNVHVNVGGLSQDQRVFGLMTDPDTAALDPIFYLHHANIDRMWAVWNTSGQANSNDPNWLKGPANRGERPFVMPMPGGQSWTYTPADVNSLSQLNYTYADLSMPAQPRPQLSRRLNRLGVAPVAANLAAERTTVTEGKNVELVGANQESLPVTGSGARTAVKMDTGSLQKVTNSLMEASVNTTPDRTFLHLENVRGARDAQVLSVFVNDHPAGSVSLFGLRKASLKDGKHGGAGLTYVIEITDILDTLHLDGALGAGSLDVRIIPEMAVTAEAQMSIGRVSIYRRGR